jgi:hypothetical protein
MRFLVLVACSSLLVDTAIIAQERAELSGFVFDSSKAVVPSVVVTAANEDTGFIYTALSGTDGHYEFPYVLPGRYKLTVRKENFRTLVRSGILLNTLQSARLDFDLQIGDMHDVVTVDDIPPAINSLNAAVGTLVTRNWIEHLPLEGRGILPLLELAPGTIITPAANGEAGQFSVNGQRPNANYFTLDGVSVNNGVAGGGLPAQLPGGSLPNMTAFGSLHSVISVDALDELRSQTSTGTAEFGRVPGGQVVLSSRSGSNEFHGFLSGVIREPAADANDWFANSQGKPGMAIRYRDAAADFGGPLRKNRTFFLLSYEGLHLNQSYAWTTDVPSLSARESASPLLQQILRAFPLPNGSDLGSGAAILLGGTSRPSQLNAGTVRFDHAIRSTLAAFGRYSESPSSSSLGYSQINSVAIQSRSITLGLTATPNSSITNELRANYSYARARSAWDSQGAEQPFNCATAITLIGPAVACPSSVRILVGGVGELIAGTDGLNRQTSWNIVDTATLHRGTHSLRIGADYLQLAPRRDAPPESMTITSPSVNDLLQNNVIISLNLAQKAANRIQQLSTFVQDTWRVTPRLSLTYGLRWEIAPPPRVANPLVVAEVPPPNPNSQPEPGATAWRFSYHDLAPRAGIAYMLTGDGRTILRSGFSFYYDANFGVATDGINGAPYNTWQFNPGTSYQNNPGPASILTYGYASDLRLPTVSEWNLTLERAITKSDSIALGYVGSAASGLLRHELTPSSASLIQAVMATNNGRSDYNSLQVQYRRRLSLGLQVLASYVWSHSSDNGSADSALYLSTIVNPRDWGSSDFDVRHSVTAAISYNLPSSALLGGVLRGWWLNAMLRARTGFPLNVLDSQTVTGLAFADIFRPDLNPGVAPWITDASVPGGRRLNTGAFTTIPNTQGSLGRNALTGFGMSQVDLALRRSFQIKERWSIELRAEAFNSLNHPNFADPIAALDNPLFGRSTSMLNLMLGTGSPATGLTPAFQIGGPRSMQFTVRFQF